MQDNRYTRSGGSHSGSVTHNRRPSIEEVIRSLRAAGSVDVADRIVAMTGVDPVQPEPLPTKNAESPKPDSATSDKAEKTKYLRGRYRFAYIYVNSNSATLDEQSKMLEAFLKAARSLRKSCPETDAILNRNYEIVPITLPRNFVTLSIRLNMHSLKQSKMLALVDKHKTLKVYFRKPRQDTQHLSDALAKPAPAVKAKTKQQQQRQKIAGK